MSNVSCRTINLKSCKDCGVKPMKGVYQSAAGFYIGYACDCGSYSRDSGYYPTKEGANEALKNNSYLRVD